MIIWSRIRASRAGEAAPKYAAHSSSTCVVVEAELLAGVAELEGRVVVAAVLAVDEPQRVAVVEVVLGQQVVVARDGRQRMDGEGRLDRAGSGPGARGSRPGSRCRARRPAPGSAPTGGTCRSRRGTAGRRGAAAARRRSASASPAPRRPSFDIVRPGRATRARRRPTPGGVERPAATRRPRRPRSVLCSSLPRSTASSSVAAPGIRTKMGTPSTVDPVVRVRQPGRDRLGRDRPPGPVRDRRDDLLDRRAARRQRASVPRYPVGVGRRRSSGRRSEAVVEHARAVIIGGGVGGTSIAYHLTELGWTDVVLVDRAELTSGSTFHSAGLVGQLRELRDPDADDDVRRRPVPAPRGRDRRPTRRGTRSARCASRRRPTRLEELRRQPGWAKTFGLPLELDHGRARRRTRFPLMSTDGVLGAVWLPTDGWLDPSGLTHALAAGARQRGATIRTAHPGASASASERGRVTGVTVEHHGERVGDPGRRRRQRRRDVRARRSARLAGVTVPIIPMAHQYLFTEADRRRPRRPAAAPRPRQPRLLPRGGRRAVHGRLRARPGAVVARRDPAGLQRQAARPGLAPLRADHGRRHPARARRSPTPRQPDDQRAGGLHAGQRVHPRRDPRSAASSSRPGSRAHGIAGAGGIGRQMATWIVDGEPELDLWKMDIRRFGAAYRSRAYTLARVDRDLRDLLRHPLPERGAPGRPAAAPVARRTSRLAGARRGVRREVRLGAPELVRAERARPATPRRSGRAAGPASTGRRRSAPRRSRPGRPPACSTRRSFAKIEVVGPGACAFLAADVRATTSTSRSGRSSTRSCSTGAAASSAT